MGLLPQQTSRLLRVSGSGLGEIRTGRIYEHADRGGIGNHFVQQLKLLRHQEGVEIAYPCDVPAWSIEAGDKPKLYGIGPSLEHDRNRGGRSLGSECGRGAGPGNHSAPPADKISGQGRQSIVMFLRPAVFDRDILPLDIAGFLKTFTEGGHKERVSSGRSAAEESDHRHRRLLRPRREWPCCRRAAEQRDELAPFHSITSSASCWRCEGTSRPSVLAVLRLIASMIFVGNSIGKSPGFAPFRILST